MTPSGAIITVNHWCQ